MVCKMKAKETHLYAEERKIKILELLRANHKVSVNGLAKLFAVSRPSIRTYLRDMEASGLLARTHGGAIPKTKTGFEPNAIQKKISNLAEKQRIARAALDLIEDGDTIILDTGTTTFELAKLLQQKKNITVVTNDLDISRLLEEYDSCNVFVLGGLLRKGFHCMVGPHSELRSRISVDKAFMATNSFSIDMGASTPDLMHAETKKNMVEMANTVILLCGSQKIGKVSFASFASPSQISVIITDSLDKKTLQELDKIGIKAIIAPPENKA